MVFYAVMQALIYTVCFKFRRYPVEVQRILSTVDWWRLLETGDEYMKGRIWWPYYGLELSKPLLKSLYRDTALKVLNFK